MAENYTIKYPIFESIKWPVLIFLYITSTPFYIAIVQAIKICTAVINNQPFSKTNVRSFTIAKYCALPECFVYSAAAFVIYYYSSAVKGQTLIMAVVVAVIIAVCSLIMSIACSVLVELLKKAIFISEENEMTI